MKEDFGTTYAELITNRVVLGLLKCACHFQFKILHYRSHINDC